MPPASYQIDPFTGKRVRLKHDAVTQMKLPPEVIDAERAKAKKQLAKMRKQWAAMEPSGRMGSAGRSLNSKYKFVAHSLWQLTGELSPAIYSEQ